MNTTRISNQFSTERRWSSGSYIAAGFAIFTFLFFVITSLSSLNWPTDGWNNSGELNPDSPEVILSQHFLADPSLLHEGDQLLAINGRTISQLLRSQHDFFHLVPPDWPDGTRLHYEILRDGQRLLVDVPVRVASLWEYYAGFFGNDPGSANLVQLTTGLSFFIIGIFVFLLRPSNRAAHALLFIGVGFFPLIENFSAPTFFYPRLPVSIPFDGWTLMINSSLMYLVLAFPYPKAPLRRFPRLTVLLLYLSWPLAFNTAYLLHLGDASGYREIAFAIYPIQVILMMIVTLVSLIHSAVTVRDPVGRNQLKWMLGGIVSFVFVGVGGWLFSSYLFPETVGKGNWLITSIGWFLLPVCLAIAITRYRLFDIDVIIRRTLQYTLLTGLLALVYFGSVVIFQQIFELLGGQARSSPLAIVLSTLAIAALFTPLRVRIQAGIDRRFYRRKYDAERTLERFAGTLRDEVDVERLSEHLISVVQETVEPETISLWVSKTRGKV